MRNLRNFRTAQGLRQQTLADRAGITQAAVSMIEAGLHEPRYSTLLLLSLALGADVEDLISSPSGPDAVAESGVGHAV